MRGARSTRRPKRGLQVAAALVLFRPDQGVQARRILIGHDIERIEVEAGTPDDTRWRGGQRYRTCRRTMEDGRIRTGGCNSRVPNRSRSGRAAGKGRPMRPLRSGQGAVAVPPAAAAGRRSARAHWSASCGSVSSREARRRGWRPCRSATRYRAPARRSKSQHPAAGSAGGAAPAGRSGSAGTPAESAMSCARRSPAASDSVGFVGRECAIARRETNQRFLGHELGASIPDSDRSCRRTDSVVPMLPTCRRRASWAATVACPGDLQGAALLAARRAAALLRTADGANTTHRPVEHATCFGARFAGRAGSGCRNCRRFPARPDADRPALVGAIRADGRRGGPRNRLACGSPRA